MEARVLFALDWGPTAQVVHQGDAANTYSSIAGKGIGIAVIDSGINYNLAPLGGGFGPGHKVVAGHDFVDDDSDPMDTDGHGTEVAGVIGANPFDFNGNHYSGVAPDSHLLALRVTHGEDGAADETIKEALDWVITNRKTYNIKVINISLGSGSYDTAHTNSTLSADFAELARLDVLVVAASGNSNDGVFGSSGIAYPAADPNVFSVGAVNSSDRISDFAQRSSNLDLLAPGEDVPTTSVSGGFSSVDGTSFASPYAAGAAALVRQLDTTLSAKGTASVLRSSGTTNYDGDNETGRTSGLFYSRLDILNALKLTDARKTSSKNNIAGVGAGASDIAYDRDGVLHLAYYDPAIHSVRYATRDTKGLWSKTQIVDTSSNDVGVYVSIDIDSTGKPAIAYFDNTNSDLKYAHFNGASWDVQTRDSAKSVGQFPSLTFDPQGNPVIAYYRKSGGDLRMQTSDASGAWTRIDVDTTGDVGAWASVSTASVGGIIAIAYVDQTNGDLKYARLANGEWTIFKVDDLSGVAYVDLNIHNDQAFISYQDLGNGDLKFAKRQDNQWFNETIYTPGNTGQFSSLVFDSSDKAHVAFYSKSKNLTYEAIGTFGSWNVRKLGSGGAWLSAASTADEAQLSFVSLDITKKKLQFGAIV
jgi:subtilisin family serine protease